MPVGTSYLGAPVMSNLVFPSSGYVDPRTGQNITYTGLRIDSVLFTVSRSKVIVSEGVLGGDGTVNEWIANGDYNIDIAFILNGESFDRGGGAFDVKSIGNRFPADDLARLLVILNAPAVVKVESRFLNYFGISELLITDYNVPQRIQSYNTQEARVSAKTELIIDLEKQAF